MKYVNVDHMLREISLIQFMEWRIYSELEPFDEERMDVRFANVVRTLMNAHRDSKKKRTPFTLKDAMIFFGDMEKGSDDKPVQQSWQAMKRIAQSWAKLYNREEAEKEKRRQQRGTQVAKRIRGEKRERPQRVTHSRRSVK